jgi:sterol desaturase/sphingolipid hydroxylase (fatty acid hydroxylase superfamily)
MMGQRHATKPATRQAEPPAPGDSPETVATAPTSAASMLPLPSEAPAISAAAARFVRSEHLAADYAPRRHIARTLIIAAAIAALGGALASRARLVEWLLMPVFFVIANFMEWAIHRHPMHHPMTPRIMYRNHAQLHHLAFTEGNLPITSSRELGLVMMPWYTMLGMFVIASPVMVLAGYLRGPGLAGIFLLGAVAYFLMYETLHALYHLPDATLDRAGIGPVRAFRRRQAHHRHHHVLGRMAHANFNVTFPWMDRLFGTAEKPR